MPNENDNNNDPQPIFTGVLYDRVKTAVQVVLPAFATLYYGLAVVWILPAAEQVVATTTLVTTFLGVLLGISSRRYDVSEAKYDGTIETSVKEDGTPVYSLVLSGDPHELILKDKVAFRVKPE